MKRSLEIKSPTMPSFFHYVAAPGKREDGAKIEGIPITELDSVEAEEFGELMKQTFIKHHSNQTEKLKS